MVGIFQQPRKLDFDLNTEVREAITFAEAKLSDLLLQNETTTLEFTGYGKRFIVQNNLSPDAFAQLSIMTAYYKLYGHAVNTYESVQTKAFAHGRTAAARSLTPEAEAYAQLYSRATSSAEETVAALRAAAAAHSSLTRQASFV